MESPARIYPINEYSLTVEFGNVINEENHFEVEKLDLLLKQKPFNGFIHAIPAYTSLCIVFDPVQVKSKWGSPFNGVFESLKNYIQELIKIPLNYQKEFRQTKTIPVFYGDEMGPDMDFLCHKTALSPSEIIQIHSQARYKVFMMGFIPGFAYLGGMDLRLEVPRKEVPRKKVKPGSVGIAGVQTGIYPLESPGGWQIIGRTPLKMFEAFRSPATYLQAGDWVEFRPIDALEFQSLSQSNS